MKYAIISSGGKQYKVSVGDEILVDKLDCEKGKAYVFPQVLMVRDDEDIMIGTPNVSNAVVTGQVSEPVKGKKISIFKYKAKVHYRRKMGFRPLYTKVKIESISIKAEKKKEKLTVKS